jgi:hypothetical protein
MEKYIWPLLKIISRCTKPFQDKQKTECVYHMKHYLGYRTYIVVFTALSQYYTLPCVTLADWLIIRSSPLGTNFNHSCSTWTFWTNMKWSWSTSTLEGGIKWSFRNINSSLGADNIWSRGTSTSEINIINWCSRFSYMIAWDADHAIIAWTRMAPNSRLWSRIKTYFFTHGNIVALLQSHVQQVNTLSAIYMKISVVTWKNINILWVKIIFKLVERHGITEECKLQFKEDKEKVNTVGFIQEHLYTIEQTCTTLYKE